jgi:HEPN domain-containing protein
MPGQDRVLVAAVSEWVLKAENDLTSAKVLLRTGAKCPTDTTCFHAQQCVEKYIKAVLVLRGIAFARTHNIRVLMHLLGEKPQFVLEPGVQDRLTDYATASRYPGEDEPITLAEARQAVGIARSVRRAIRRLLPSASLRKRTN